MNNTGRLLFLIALVIQGCVDHSEVTVPAYLYIPAIEMMTGKGEGTASQSFRDAWVYVNDTFVGAYETPCKVPVTILGNVEVKVFAGIRENGMITHPTRYSMTAPYSEMLALEPTVTDTIRPIVHYYGQNVFTFNETFDGSHFFKSDRDGDAFTQITLTAQDQAFEGRNSGEILLTEDHPLLIAEYDIARAVPLTPNQVYIELNYKSDVEFYVGFYGYTPGLSPRDYVLGKIRPKDSWNKIYFNFTPYVNECACTDYRIAIYAAYDTAVSKTIQQVYLDNFKLIHQ